MQKEVREKIEFEWKKFHLDCMRTSKENVFAICKEISIKKEIVSYLRTALDNKSCMYQLQKLLSLENIIESCYRYVTDYPETKTVESRVQGWMQGL